MSKDVVELVVDSDERTGQGGFLEIRRFRLRNRRSDGSLSPQYVCDAIVRPYGQDAVIVAVYARREGRIDVLVRSGLRPPLAFARDVSLAPLPEPQPEPFVTELVAGILEKSDRGEEGLRARAAAEVFEEAGFIVEPRAVEILGAGVYPAPGMLLEKFYFTAVEVDPATQQPLSGDGSPMEDGATTRWLPLDDALAACVRGDIVDLKTELGLRRLRDRHSGRL